MSDRVIICPGTAHQLVNTSDAERRHLAFSTKREPEICEYADSGKVLAFDGFGDSRDQSKVEERVRRSAAGVDYRDGEG